MRERSTPMEEDGGGQEVGELPWQQAPQLPAPPAHRLTLPAPPEPPPVLLLLPPPPPPPMATENAREAQGTSRQHQVRPDHEGLPAQENTSPPPPKDEGADTDESRQGKRRRAEDEDGGSEAGSQCTQGEPRMGRKRRYVRKSDWPEEWRQEFDLWKADDNEAAKKRRWETWEEPLQFQVEATIARPHRDLLVQWRKEKERREARAQGARPFQARTGLRPRPPIARGPHTVQFHPSGGTMTRLRPTRNPHCRRPPRATTRGGEPHLEGRGLHRRGLKPQATTKRHGKPPTGEPRAPAEYEQCTGASQAA